MVKLTMIVRLFDGLPLCESLELDKIANLEMYKQQAKVSSNFSSENEGEVEHKRPTFQRIALATETEADADGSPPPPDPVRDPVPVTPVRR